MLRARARQASKKPTVISNISHRRISNPAPISPRHFRERFRQQSKSEQPPKQILSSAITRSSIMEPKIPPKGKDDYRHCYRGQEANLHKLLIQEGLSLDEFNRFWDNYDAKNRDHPFSEEEKSTEYRQAVSQRILGCSRMQRWPPRKVSLSICSSRHSHHGMPRWLLAAVNPVSVWKMQIAMACG